MTAIRSCSDEVRSPVVIFTHSGDLHASYFCDLASRRDLEFRLIFTDRMSAGNSVTFDQKSRKVNFIDATGVSEALEDPGVVWWRRISGVQQGRELSVEHLEFINMSWQNMFEGDLHYYCRNKVFVNDPIKSRLGYNKLCQLHVAKCLGFDVPDTLVTNDVNEVAEFCSSRNVIVKPLISSSKTPIYVNEFQFQSNYARQVSICPLIYQELISGSVNFRVNVFGESVYAFEVRSNSMDWRKGKYDARYVDLEPRLTEQCVAFTQSSGLKMCCIDLRVHKDGLTYFLEGNPQGQFLFLEASSGFPLMERFIDFICDTHKAS